MTPFIRHSGKGKTIWTEDVSVGDKDWRLQERLTTKEHKSILWGDKNATF